MIFCYIDESGTADIPGNTSHYVLAGLAIPDRNWKKSELSIQAIKDKYQLQNAEIHTGWILWKYLEQNKILNFESLSYSDRIYEVEKYRNSELIRLQKLAHTKQGNKLYHKTKKNYRLTKDYIHLSYKERKQFIFEIAAEIGSWGYCRLFAECIDKLHFNPAVARDPIDGQAFEQIVSRFAHYLKIYSKSAGETKYGLLIHDNNETVKKRHTLMMKEFHVRGTLWTHVRNIIETPMFVDSQLTSMVQLSDVCAYAIRRFLENGELDLFNEVFKRADKKDGKVVGIRHFSKPSCNCLICKSHK